MIFLFCWSGDLNTRTQVCPSIPKRISQCNTRSSMQHLRFPGWSYHRVKDLTNSTKCKTVPSGGGSRELLRRFVENCLVTLHCGRMRTLRHIDNTRANVVSRTTSHPLPALAPLPLPSPYCSCLGLGFVPAPARATPQPP